MAQQIASACGPGSNRRTAESSRWPPRERHSGAVNATADRTRYLLQVHYARRMVAQKFSPYLEWRFNPAVLAACTPRQRRLLGDHRPGAYD